MSRQEKYQTNPNIQIVTGVCPHDCPDTCSWQVAVDKQTGQAMDLWGHPDHPVTRGQLCGKVNRYLERTYHPDRLRVPLKRVGAKGEGRFEPISWEQAIRDIAGRLSHLVSEFGSESVLPYSYAGTMGLLQGQGMANRFFNRLGASKLARTICSEAGFEGYLYTIGAAIGQETESFAHSKLILIWGSNTLTSNMHLWPFVQKARKQGARIIVIDPAHTRTAQAADEWIPIRPGTDGALALAMMNVIITEERYDADYVARYTLGFDALTKRVSDWTPQRAMEITGVPAERIVALARDYAATQPAGIRINYGVQRHYGGGMAVRNITCLPALVGAWRHYGGGIQLSTSGGFRHLDFQSLDRPDLEQLNGLGRPPRTINMNRLGDALSLDPARIARAHYRPRPVDPLPSPENAGPPVKALIVFNANPATVAPDQNAIRQGLQRDDLFTVVLEHFQTDTADFADYVLPATTQLEHWDILKPYGHYFLSLNRPAIAPVGESLPNSEIFRRLAHAMGYDDPCFEQSDEEILQEFVESQHHPDFATVTWDRLLEQGFVRLNLPTPFKPFAEGGFPTPSGKCEFYSQRMADDGYDPLPDWTPPRHLAHPSWLTASRQQPALVCISPPAHSFLNSTFVNVDRFRNREEKPILWIHPADATARGIADGDEVTIGNDLGEARLTARITEDIIQGTVLAPGVWWTKFSPDRRNINQVTPQDETDMGASGSFYDVKVWVSRTADPREPAIQEKVLSAAGTD